MQNKLFKNKTDPKRDLPLSTDDILSVCSGGTFYEDIYVSSETFINLMVIGSNGVFIFSPLENSELIKKKVKEIVSFFDLNKKSVFIFFFREEDVTLADGNGNSTGIDDFFYEFENLYTNLSRPEIDKHYLNMDSLTELIKEPEAPVEYDSQNENNGKTFEHEGIVFEIEESFARENDGDAEFVKPLVTVEEQERISLAASAVAGNDFPDAKYKVDEDGNEWILKDSSIKVKGFDTGLVGKKEWFKISDKNENRMLLVTAFGGVLGLHKLVVGNIIGFLGYLLTCGGMGVLTLLDVIQFAFGSAYYDEILYEENDDGSLKRIKNRTFYKRVKNIGFILFSLIIAALVTFLFVNFVYQPVLKFAIEALTASSQGIDEETANEQLKIIENIVNFDF